MVLTTKPYRRYATYEHEQVAGNDILIASRSYYSESPDVGLGVVRLSAADVLRSSDVVWLDLGGHDPAEGRPRWNDRGIESAEPRAPETHVAGSLIEELGLLEPAAPVQGPRQTSRIPQWGMERRFIQLHRRTKGL